MVRIGSGFFALLVVSLLGCSAGISGGGSSSDDTTGTGGGGTSSSTGASNSTGASGGGTGGSAGAGGSSSTSGGGASELTCAEIEVELPKERAAIMSCTADAQCGQELKGTSCGCTRNLVARLDADTTRFYELLTKSQELECDDSVGSTCDCPAANGFVCKNGLCAWNYIP